MKTISSYLSPSHGLGEVTWAPYTWSPGQAIVDAFTAALKTLSATQAPVNGFNLTADDLVPGTDANGKLTFDPSVPMTAGACPSQYMPVTANNSGDYGYDTDFLWCRPVNHNFQSTNGLYYEPPPGSIPDFWLSSVANAAAEFWKHDMLNAALPTNPLELRPWLDKANAWFWAVSAGKNIPAKSLPWNDVAWSAISYGDAGVARWAWLRDVGSSAYFDWAKVSAYILSVPMIDPTPNASFPFVNFMTDIPSPTGGAPGMTNAAVQAWRDSYYGKYVPWDRDIWLWRSAKSAIPWQLIPWVKLDLSVIKNADDMIAQLAKFVDPYQICIGGCPDDAACFEKCKSATLDTSGPCPIGGSKQFADGKWSCIWPECPTVGQVRDGNGNCVAAGFTQPVSGYGLTPVGKGGVNVGGGGLTPVGPVITVKYPMSCPSDQVAVNGSCQCKEAGYTFVNGKCTKTGTDGAGNDVTAPTGLSTGAKVGVAVVIAAGLLAAHRLAMGKPVLPGIKSGARKSSRNGR